MAGIYLHIPFCKKACFYCDFHFSVSMKSKNDIIMALHKELVVRRDFIKKESIETIYFGGGTPSILTSEEIKGLVHSIRKEYDVADDVEITLEANPDDLSYSYLKELFSVGVNRLSVGIQSFDDEHLKWMNRSHTNEQSEQCIKDAALVGFRDITIDLIYGLPQLSSDQWLRTVKKALDLPINHLSAYSLTLEQQTPYDKLVRQKKYKEPDNDLAAEHFRILVEKANDLGWEHYEVSNFCKFGNYSKHNTSYWQNKRYLGIGPSAHSFDGENRSWNVSSNAKYLEKIARNVPTFSLEKLKTTNKVNEYLLTGLRTKWGVDLVWLSSYGYDLNLDYKDKLTEWASKGWIIMDNASLKLTTKGFLFADFIASELFWVD